MEELKGFIEVTTEESWNHGFGDKGVIETKVLCHFTQIIFKYKACYLHNTILKESYEEIKQLIKKAQ